MAINLNIITFNVQGLRADIKRRTLFRYFHNHCKNSVIFLQETHSSPNIEKTWRNEWGADIKFSHYANNSRGVCILFPNNLDYSIEKCISDEDGRFLILSVNIDDKMFVLANVYAPTKNHDTDQCAFLNTFRFNMLDFLGENILIGGDFNITLNPSIDKSGGRKEGPSKYRDSLIEFIEELGLNDAWRTKNPGVKHYTWSSGDGSIKSRLDFWLISEFMCNNIKSSKILPLVKSDHRACLINIQGDLFQKRGPGFWKFNSDLLHHKEFIQTVKEVIKIGKNVYTDANEAILWELIKCDIRTKAISFAKQKSRERRKEENELMCELEKLTKILDEGDMSVNDKLNETRKHLERILENKTKGAMLRSHARWAEEGERSSKYFLGLEKRNYKDKCINQIINSKNEKISEPKAILSEERNYFKTLYKSNINKNEYENLTHIKKKFLESDNIIKLNEIEKQSCEGILTEKECAKALKDFKNNKSPGTDGFTAEFYKFFWVDIKELVVNSLNFGYSIGNLSIEQSRGIISLLPKKYKDKLYLNNWRPISLLNIDYKIGAKSLAKRMQPLLQKLVHHNQSGYVKDRYIGENIRNVIDIMQYTSFKNIAGLILQIDFEKAYDSIEWSYIDEALSAMNFGHEFRNWVKTLYNNSQSCVINNGYTSDFFNLEKSVRQGCPLAPFLFVIVVEVLSIAIRNDANIKGINVEDQEIKLSQLADDTTCFVTDEESARNLINTLKLFATISGLKCNVDKTEAMWIGANADQPEGNIKVKWKKNIFSTLGVTFMNNEQEMCDTNLDDKIAKISKTFKQWKCRDLTLIGRILIAKTLGLSQVYYLAGNIFITEEKIDIIQSKVNNFIWKEGNPKVKQTTISQSIKYGGLKMPIIKTQIEAFALSYIKRMTSPVAQAWKIILQTYIPDIKINDLVYTRCEIPDSYIRNLPLFYKTIFDAWNKLRSKFLPKSVNDVRREWLWFNPLIKVNKEPVFYKHWYKHGIRMIHDIVDENGLLLPDSQIEEKFGFHINFLEYYSLRSAIPHDWKQQIRNCAVLTLNLTFYLGDKPFANWPSKDIYWHLQPKGNIENITSVKKWTELFPNQNFDWESIFMIPFNSTFETRLQAFQYSIIHRFVPHNKRLQIIGIKNSNICSNCLEIDTIEHRFIKCAKVQKMWSKFVKWWNFKTMSKIELSDEEILFGVLDISQYALNCSILICKYHIHASLCTDISYSFEGFKSLLNRKIEMEKYVLSKSNKKVLFMNRWNELYDCLN